MNWEELYTHLVLTTGHDYDYVRNHMDLPRLSALNAYNKKFPPNSVNTYRIRRLIEAYFGIEDDDTKEVDEQQEPDILETLQNFPQG